MLNHAPHCDCNECANAPRGGGVNPVRAFGGGLLIEVTDIGGAQDENQPPEGDIIAGRTEAFTDFEKFAAEHPAVAAMITDAERFNKRTGGEFGAACDREGRERVASYTGGALPGALWGLMERTAEGDGDGREFQVRELRYPTESDDVRNIMHRAKILGRVELTDGQGGIIHALLIAPWWSVDGLYAVALDRGREAFTTWRVK